MNKPKTRLIFDKGQAVIRLQSALVCRDNGRHHHKLLLKAINSNTTKERSMAK